MKYLAPFVLAGAASLGLVTAFNIPTAFSQPAPEAAHPALSQVQKSGTVARYVVGPMGHVQGFVLNDGTLVRLGGRHDENPSSQIALGQAVNVQGFAPPGTSGVIVRATVYGPDGSVLAQPGEHRWMHRGPHAGSGQGGWDEHHHEGEGQGSHQCAGHRGGMQARLLQLAPRSANGTITHVLGGHRGFVHGVLLSDGTSVFFTPALARSISGHPVQVGQSVQVTGRGNTYSQGSSIMAEHITFADGTTANGPIGSEPDAK